MNGVLLDGLTIFGLGKIACPGDPCISGHMSGGIAPFFMSNICVCPALRRQSPDRAENGSVFLVLTRGSECHSERLDRFRGSYWSDSPTFWAHIVTK